MKNVKEYAKGDFTLIWQPDLCTHAGICVKTLPNVYDPNKRPWVNLENATVEELTKQVALCPSGALSIKPVHTIRTDVEDNGKKGRFVIYEDDVFAGEMTFTWAGVSKFIIDHTGVESAFGGRGYGKKLVKAAVDYAREKGIKIIPLCPFAKKEFRDHSEYNDVLPV